MSYLHFNKDRKIKQFVSANDGWLAMMWDGENDYYTCPVAMWAVMDDGLGEKNEDDNFIMIEGVIGDSEIGGEWSLSDDEFFIGYIEPGGDPPDDEEIKIRIEIVRDLMEERATESDEGNSEQPIKASEIQP